MKSLIFGITGQDGAYLCAQLLNKNQTVCGASRKISPKDIWRLTALKCTPAVNLVVCDVTNRMQVYEIISKYKPDYIYNFSGQSSVAESFKSPEFTYKSIVDGTRNIFDAVLRCQINPKIFNAISSDCYGETGNQLADESQTFKPVSPYAVAKAVSFDLGAEYRAKYELRVTNGILFNHDSVYRARNFVVMKIVLSALTAESNQLDKLELGNIDIYRDWGYAPEVVELIYQLMQHQPGDFNICSGNPTSLRTILEGCFDFVGLDYKKYLITNKSFFRPSEIEYVGGSPLRLIKALGHKLEISGCEPSKLILQEFKKDKNYELQL